MKSSCMLFCMIRFRIPLAIPFTWEVLLQGNGQFFLTNSFQRILSESCFFVIIFAQRSSLEGKKNSNKEIKYALFRIGGHLFYFIYSNSYLASRINNFTNKDAEIFLSPLFLRLRSGDRVKKFLNKKQNRLPSGLGTTYFILITPIAISQLASRNSSSTLQLKMPKFFFFLPSFDFAQDDKGGKISFTLSTRLSYYQLYDFTSSHHYDFTTSQIHKFTNSLSHLRIPHLASWLSHLTSHISTSSHHHDFTTLPINFHISNPASWLSHLHIITSSHLTS